jgi:plasmid stability protein
MAKIFTITLPDDLEQALTIQANSLNQSLEDTLLQVLSEQLKMSSSLSQEQPIKADPLLKLIGSLNIDIPDLAENHDHYIGQTLYEELKNNE